MRASADHFLTNLCSAGVDGVGDIDVAGRRDRHVVRFAEFAEGLARLAGRGDRLAVGVELQDLAREAGGQIHLPSGPM